MKNLATDELATALRNDVTCDDCICAAECNNDTCLLYAVAADAIENLQKQNNAQQDIIEKLKIRLEQTQAERDAALSAVDRMAEYIVTFGLVDYWLCDDIPRELHLKHQPKDDGNYENGPCIECVKEYYLHGPQKEA